MMKKIFTSSALLGCLILSFSTASAADRSPCNHVAGSYTINNWTFARKRLTEDRAIGKLTNELNSKNAPYIRNWMGNRYDIHGKFWNDGFGWWEPENENKPYLRTMNALYLLTYAAPDYSRSSHDNGGDILRWGGNYVAKHLHELVPDCQNKLATTYIPDSGWSVKSVIQVFGDEVTKLHFLFFYDFTAVERALSITHKYCSPL